MVVGVVMKALVVFEKTNAHPLAGLLDRRQRHVWCAVCDEERDVWISYDWRQGIPRLRAEAPSGFALAEHYRDQGYDVAEIRVSDTPVAGPFVLNNCVGHTKVILGIKSWALTPRQLYKHLTRERTMWSFIRDLSFVPGFGGDVSPAPPPPPPPPPEPPKKTDEAVQQARSDEQKRARLRAGTGGAVKTGPLGTTSQASTTQRTLLGN